MAKKQARSRKLPSRARLHDAYHCGQIRYLRALQGVSTERF